VFLLPPPPLLLLPLLLLLSLTPDGKKDPMSLHGSCPTLKGDKWSATK
jgi:prolyl 4-hydroxylase